MKKELLKKVIINIIIKVNSSEIKYNLVFLTMYFYLLKLNINIDTINRITTTYTSLYKKLKKEKYFFEIIIEELYNKYLYYSFKNETISINFKEFICLIGKCIFENDEYK